MKRRELDLHTIDEVIAELDRLQQGCEQGGNWNLGQICNHLTIAVRGSLDGFGDVKVAWYMRLFMPFFIKRMFKTRKIPVGVKTPAYFLPKDNPDESVEVQELREQLQRFRDHKGALHPSPVAGRLTREQWTDMHCIHCSHHLSFLHPKSMNGEN